MDAVQDLKTAQRAHLWLGWCACPEATATVLPAKNSTCLPARPRPCPAAGVFSVLAVLLGQLPGDWGFFGAYLTGGVVLAVLAVGSTAPGLLQGIIDAFSQLWPDYKERVVAHEAAHLLIGECLGGAAFRGGVVCGRRASAGGREGAQQSCEEG